MTFKSDPQTLYGVAGASYFDALRKYEQARREAITKKRDRSILQVLKSVLSEVDYVVVEQAAQQEVTTSEEFSARYEEAKAVLDKYGVLLIVQRSSKDLTTGWHQLKYHLYVDGKLVWCEGDAE